MTRQNPWYMDQIRRSYILWMTLPLQASARYLETWSEVYGARHG